MSSILGIGGLTIFECPASGFLVGLEVIKQVLKIFLKLSQAGRPQDISLSQIPLAIKTSLLRHLNNMILVYKVMNFCLR